jgi:hypothetical protein
MSDPLTRACVALAESSAHCARLQERVARLEAALRQCLSVLPHGLPGSKYDNAKVAARAALRGEEKP